MTKQEYKAMMLIIANAMTVLRVGGGRVPIGHDGQPAWVMVTVSVWEQSVGLLIDAKNLYLQGFKNKADAWFVFKNIGVQALVDPVATIQYETDYKTLGLDRDGTIQLTLAELANAVTTLYNFDTGKKQDTLKTPMWQCAVGLMEALRFKDVFSAVASGKEFDGSLLDWDRRTKEGDVNVQVRLV